MAASLSITNTTKGKLPRLPFQVIKNKILGSDYILSLVFIGNTRSRSLNKAYRKKNKPANVLSFPLGKNEGEIFIDLAHARKEAKNFDDTYPHFVGFLFIHGLLHLKGYAHSSKMEHEEKRFRKMFRI
jgi:rRNA maturation RNase YbeY